jgi:hypothetical protein
VRRALDHCDAVVLDGEPTDEVAYSGVLKIVRSVVSEQERESFRWKTRKPCYTVTKL